MTTVIDYAIAVEHLMGSGVDYGVADTYADLVSTWRDDRPIPTHAELEAAWEDYLVLKNEQEVAEQNRQAAILRLQNYDAASLNGAIESIQDQATADALSQVSNVISDFVLVFAKQAR
jgi:hypothetical protein